MTCSASNPHHLSRSAARAPVPEPTCVSTRVGRVLAALAGLSLVLAGCASAPPKPLLPSTVPAEIAEIRPGSGILIGYLPRGELPDSLALLPPPPAEGSAALAADQAAFQATQSLRASARWQLAARDNELQFPRAAETFSCALDLPIGESSTPHVNMLLRRTLADAGLSTYRAKDRYQRARPFVRNQAATCVPQEEAKLAKDGSYPSGHSALGWAWALILAELSPERADRLLARGYAFGQSRMVCGVHWQSDVDAGRVMGSATVARLHADPAFRAQMDAARAEVAALRGRGLRPVGDCVAEAAALKEPR